jgi:hypothetical protein
MSMGISRWEICLRANTEDRDGERGENMLDILLFFPFRSSRIEKVEDDISFSEATESLTIDMLSKE